MKRSRFTEEQVTYSLTLAEQGTPMTDVCLQFGIAEATFFVWRKLSRSTFYRKSCAPQQLELRRRIREIAIATAVRLPTDLHLAPPRRMAN